MNDNDLAHCPFCGGKARIVILDEMRFVHCLQCHGGAGPYKCTADAIDGWNCRHGEKVLAAENDMLFDKAAKRLAEIYQLRADNRTLRRELAMLQLSNPIARN